MLDFTPGRRIYSFPMLHIPAPQDILDQVQQASGSGMQYFFDSTSHMRRFFGDSDRFCAIRIRSEMDTILDISNGMTLKNRMSAFFANGVQFFGDFVIIEIWRPDGTITKAFLELLKIKKSLQEYPLLDEDDYNKRVWKKSIENIEAHCQNLVSEDAPADWAAQVLSWCLTRWPGEEFQLGDNAYWLNEPEAAIALMHLGWADLDGVFWLIDGIVGQLSNKEVELQEEYLHRRRKKVFELLRSGEDYYVASTILSWANDWRKDNNLLTASDLGPIPDEEIRYWLKRTMWICLNAQNTKLHVQVRDQIRDMTTEIARTALEVQRRIDKELDALHIEAKAPRAVS